MNTPFCICFAGAVGSSKTPIAYHLSYTFNLPVLNTDAIRSEIAEDGYTGQKALDILIHLRDARIDKILKSQSNFILDASVDRSWGDLRVKLKTFKYDWYIISNDLSRTLLEQLYHAKGYSESLERLHQLQADHQNFLEQYGGEVGCHIDDKTFSQRLDISENAVRSYLSQ